MLDCGDYCEAFPHLEKGAQFALQLRVLRPTAQQVDQIECYSRAYPRYERFRPSVVLIEDEASGTHLIQELITEGLQGVTRYQPQAGTVMRVHAQSAIIENSFVRVPDTAPRLAQYLYEMRSFPNGPLRRPRQPERTDAGLVQARHRPQLQCRDLRIVPPAR
jgi:hypothetical protein